MFSLPLVIMQVKVSGAYYFSLQCASIKWFQTLPSIPVHLGLFGTNDSLNYAVLLPADLFCPFRMACG
jgi:hypothetical protein